MKYFGDVAHCHYPPIYFEIGYAIKKVIRTAVVIVGLFIDALAYLEYQQIIEVDWEEFQAVSQSGITWVADSHSLSSAYLHP
jgi:uncharacterized membrane protein (Fun14 family)